MFFRIQRAKYRVPAQFNNGVHTVQIKSITPSEDANAFYIVFLFENGLTINKKFILFPDKYGPVDALIDAVLPNTEQEFEDLSRLVDQCVDIVLLNEEVEGRVFANIKRIHKASRPFVLASSPRQAMEQQNEPEPIDLSGIEPIVPDFDIDDLDLDFNGALEAPNDDSDDDFDSNLVGARR